MNTVVHQSLSARLAAWRRRHPRLMLISTLILAAVAIAALLSQDQAAVILYEAF